MPRLFTGLDVPENIRAHLKIFSGGLPGARWIDPENYHITLRFVGDVDPHIHQDLQDMLWRMPLPEPFDIRIEGLGIFGGKNPRYLYAKVTSNPMLDNLYILLERMITRLGLPPTKRKFTPHISLARLKQVDPQILAHYLHSQIGLKQLDFTVNQFHLYSSKPQKGGGPYVVEQSFTLAT